jgi:uncharacterized protein
MPSVGPGGTDARTAVGSVVALWRYPVKSMLGEELAATQITEGGLVGDRAYALVDQLTGKVASAKNPRKWGSLFDFRASFTEPPRAYQETPAVRITLPDGTTTSSDRSGVDARLSQALGAQVRLTKPTLEAPGLEEYWPDLEGLAHRDRVTDEGMPPRTFFDGAVVHVLTTSTLTRLRELYPEGRFEVPRFRPNIVIEPSPPMGGFVENGWVGRTLQIGSEVRLRITRLCGRCVMTTLPQSDLPRDLEILRTAARHNHVKVGAYASVLREGTIQRGDPIQVE